MVALFIDYENVHYSLENEYGVAPDLELCQKIYEKAVGNGCAVIARSYADWEQIPGMAGIWRSLGVEPIYALVKGAGKWAKVYSNAVDLQLSVDWMEALMKEPDLKVFALVSGDRDYLPILHKALSLGKDVEVLTFRAAAGELLDRVMRYRIQYLDEFLGLQMAKKPAPAVEREVTETELEWLVKLLDAQEKRLPFVGLKYFRDQVFTPFLQLYTGRGMEESADRAQFLIQSTIDKGLMSVHKVDNPLKPDYPTTAIRLNNSHEKVRKFLEKAPSP